MPLYSAIPEGVAEVDIIVAGGGTAGCTLAGRLAAADPKLSILLIESGPDNYDMATSVHMGLATHNLMPGSRSCKFYKANPESYLAGREIVVPTGGCLGGGSAVNIGLYTRAQRADFDSWHTPGWSTKDLWPYMKKLETYHGPGAASDHGFEGPIHVSSGGYRHPVTIDELMSSAKSLGWDEITDLQNLENNDGFERWLRTVTPQGLRSTASHGYIHPLLRDGKHPNLHVLTETHVVRVVFDDDKRAVGVEVTPNAESTPVLPGELDQKAVKTIIRARKLVVCSAGALGTPPILERSGIGAKSVLERAGVPVVEDLPGVGLAYQDHPFLLSVYKTNLKPHETMDLFYTGQKGAEQGLADKDPMLGWNGVDFGSKIRPDAKTREKMGSEFQAYWDEWFEKEENRPVMFVGSLNGFAFGNPSAYQPGTQYHSMACFQLYPKSLGHVHITGPEVTDRLDFDTGLLSDPADMAPMVWSYKLAREIIRRCSFYRGELAATHPRFPNGSAATSRDFDDAPKDVKDIKDIEYTAEDDAAIEQFVRETVGTTWHSLGTAPMAPRDQNGVVDKDLDVYGVKRLKVVDLSIARQNIGGNTNNTAFVIGERAAEIVAAELGIKLPTSGKLVR